MSEIPTPVLLRQLRTREAEAAWAYFIDEYAPLIFRVIKYFETDSDDAADCFQFVCEQLVKDQFRRLCQFKPDGPASFATWLRAVVRNLCLDWRRKQHGRPRLFRSIERLSLLDQEVFRCVHERGGSEQEALQSLAPRFPELTIAHVAEAIERINRTLTASQSATLRARMPAASQSSDTETFDNALSDPAANPETMAIEKEKLELLRRAVNRLAKDHQLLLRLRFEEALTLEEIARLLQLGNAQRADREIKSAVSALRIEMNSIGAAGAGGKDSHPSVKVEWKESV